MPDSSEKHVRGPVNLPLRTKKLIQADFANTQNKQATGRRFGISPRTVGRVVSEMLGTQGQSPIVKASESIVQPVIKVVYMPHRQALNMDILGAKTEVYRLQGPYCDAKVKVFNGYPVCLPDYFDSSRMSKDFQSRHPVSPECKVFPYYPVDGREPSSPAPGEICTCPDCKSWRGQLYFQLELELRYIQSVATHATYRERYRR